MFFLKDEIVDKGDVGFVCLFVCLFIQMIFPPRELGQLPQWDLNAKLATTNLSHTNMGLTSMIMNYTNQTNCDSVPRR